MQADAAQPTRTREAVAFIVLAILIWPVIACGVVGAYGLAFWIYFMLAGPPGSH